MRSTAVQKRYNGNSQHLIKPAQYEPAALERETLDSSDHVSAVQLG